MNTHAGAPVVERRGKVSTGLGWPGFHFNSGGIKKLNKLPFELPASVSLSLWAPQRTPPPPDLLIGELLSPNKQVDPREASASAKEGDLHALVRIPETEQQGSGVLLDGKQIIAFAF